VVRQINTFKPQLLFVAFGNPKQEIWIHNNLPKLNVGGAMAVGGAFRYVAGISKLPPKWMAACGLEWLWRLITEPKRISRILNAVIVFPLKIILYKLS
jgi:N-acetylglucosaminyldiphosphoundecaprenol N-acetyl-beta-D-mannosaminyltransferase